MMTTLSKIAFTAAALAFGACSPRPTPEAHSAPAPAGAGTAPTAAGSAPAVNAPAAVPEAASTLRPRCAHHFEAFDENGDQRVSRQEFLERPHAQPDPEAIFEARDGDADGSLTSEEFCSGWRGNTAAGPGMGPGGGARKEECAGPGTGPCAEPGMGMAPGAGPGMRGGRGAGRGMGMGRGGPRCEAHFARFDTNADGNVSAAEFGAMPHPHGDAQAIFTARDQNHDGLLTKAEFCAPWNPPSPAPAP